MAAPSLPAVTGLLAFLMATPSLLAAPGSACSAWFCSQRPGLLAAVPKSAGIARYVLSCPVCAVLFALVVCVVVSSLGHSFTKSHMLLVMTLVALLGSPGGQCPYKWLI